MIIGSIVTAISQLLLSRFQNNNARRERETAAIANAVAPALESADDIIARLFDVIKRKRSFGFTDFTFPKRLSHDTLVSPPLMLTTIYRFAKFFTSETYLQKKIAEYSDVSRVRAADWYAANKVRMALKGNVCGAPCPLPTESQQFIGAKFLSLTETGKPDDLTFYTFLSKITGDREAEGAARCIASALNFDEDFTKLEPQQVTLALTLIYMIDMYQDLRDSSKWEEFRVFLLSIIRAWNSLHAGRPIYLYSRGDLEGQDYRDTFAKLHLSGESAHKRNKRLARRQGRERAISAKGVVRKHGSTDHFFEFTKSPEDLLGALQSLS